MKEPSGSKERMESRIRRILIRLAIGSAVLIGMLAILLGSLIGREYLREIPRPVFSFSTDELLHPAAAAAQAAVPPASAPELTTHSKKTTITQPREALKFEPMIPDAPDIPEALRAAASGLNLHFDAIFQRIQDFEREKDKLPAAKAAEVLAHIYDNYANLFNEMCKPLNYGISSTGGQGRINERNLIFMSWYYQTAIQLRERAGDWLAAAGFSRQFWNHQRFFWENAEYVNTPGQPVYRSDYDRANQYRDYQRLLYYYRQVGGMNGFVHVGELVLQRKKREWMDALGKIEYGIRH